MRRTVMMTAAAAAALTAAPALAAASVSTTPVNGATITGSTDNAAPAGSTSVIRFNFAGDVNNAPATPGLDGSSTGPRYFSTSAEAAAENISYSTTGNAGRVPGTGRSPHGATPTYDFRAPSPQDGGFFGVGGMATINGQDVVSSATFGATDTNPGFSSISAYFGSINAFNVVQLFYNGGTGFDTFNGTQLLQVLPGQTTQGNGRVTFDATGGRTFSAVRFFNNEGFNGSFEFDNLAFTAAVPEPATWAMMVLGFGVIGFGMRRRKSVKTTVQFA